MKYLFCCFILLLFSSFKYPVHEEIEIDYYKEKEKRLKEINDTYNFYFEIIDKRISQLERLKIENKEKKRFEFYTLFTHALWETLQMAEELECERDSVLNVNAEYFNRKIKIEHETTAFYSMPNYEGEELIIVGDVNYAEIGFVPKSIRIARGASLEIWPKFNYKKEARCKSSQNKNKEPVFGVKSWRLYKNR